MKREASGPTTRRCNHANMRHTTGQNRHNSPKEPQGSSDRPAVLCSPQRRRMYLDGLRAWARVAVRSYAKRHGAPGNPSVKPDGDGRTRAAPNH